MTHQCEYGECTETAVYLATYWESQVYDGVDPENDKQHRLLVCQECADNAMPDTAKLIVLTA